MQPLTEAGYVGEDVERVILLKAIQVADYDKNVLSTALSTLMRSIRSIRNQKMFLSPRDGFRKVQQALLKILEGTGCSAFRLRGEGKHPHQELIQIDTTNGPVYLRRKLLTDWKRS